MFLIFLVFFSFLPGKFPDAVNAKMIPSTFHHLSAPPPMIDFASGMRTALLTFDRLTATALSLCATENNSQLGKDFLYKRENQTCRFIEEAWDNMEQRLSKNNTNKQVCSFFFVFFL